MMSPKKIKQLPYYLSTIIMLIGVLGLSNALAGTYGDGALQIETGFFQTPMFKTSNYKIGKIFDFTSMSPEFEEILSLHPEAQEAGKLVNSYNKLAYLGSLVMVAGSALMLVDTLGQVSDVKSGKFPDNNNSLSDTGFLISIAGGGMTIVLALLAKSQLHKTIDIFNENEKANPKLSLRDYLSPRKAKQELLSMNFRVDKKRPFYQSNKPTNKDFIVSANIKYRF